MNWGRYAIASAAVFVVRDVMNVVFYSVINAPHYEQLAKDHPGMFRTVIPGYVGTDLLFALILTYLIARASGVFGGGVKGGSTIGLIVGLLMGVVGDLYMFWGVTYIAPGPMVQDMIYQTLSLVLQGALAGKLLRGAAV